MCFILHFFILCVGVCRMALKIQSLLTIEFVLRTMQGEEPGLAEFETQFSPENGALQILPLRLCLGNILENPRDLMLKSGQQQHLKLSHFSISLSELKYSSSFKPSTDIVYRYCPYLYSKY